MKGHTPLIKLPHSKKWSSKLKCHHQIEECVTSFSFILCELINKNQTKKSVAQNSNSQKKM